MSAPVYLVRLPLRLDALYALGRAHGAPALREVDDGYLVHWMTRAVWGDSAPAPFALRPEGPNRLDLWGYTRISAADLVAQAAGAPAEVQRAMDLERFHGRPLPVLSAGRAVGFTVEACPVVRLKKAKGEFRAGAEIDAFLARALDAGPDAGLVREAVYREWFQGRFPDRGTSGATLRGVRVERIARARLHRRTQGESRRGRALDRPRVGFAGQLVVEDGERFLEFLAHGIGRHRAFGFGMLLVGAPQG